MIWMKIKDEIRPKWMMMWICCCWSLYRNWCDFTRPIKSIGRSSCPNALINLKFLVKKKVKKWWKSCNRQLFWNTNHLFFDFDYYYSCLLTTLNWRCYDLVVSIKRHSSLFFLVWSEKKDIRRIDFRRTISFEHEKSQRWIKRRGSLLLFYLKWKHR